MSDIEDYAEYLKRILERQGRIRERRRERPVDGTPDPVLNKEYESAFKEILNDWDPSRLDLPSSTLRTPFAQARDTYGHRTGSLISSRYQKLLNSKEEMAKLPRSVVQSMPSGVAEDWDTIIPSMQTSPGTTISGSEAVTHTTNPISRSSFPNPEKTYILFSGEPSQETRDHEFTHALDASNRTRLGIEGPAHGVDYDYLDGGVGIPQSGGSMNQDRRNTIAWVRSLPEDTRQDRRIKRGAKEILKNSEAMAYLTEAIRVFARANEGRPPETEDEVIKALDMTIKNNMDKNNLETVGALEGLKIMPWVRTLGKYLVFNNSNQGIASIA